MRQVFIVSIFDFNYKLFNDYRFENTPRHTVVKCLPATVRASHRVVNETLPAAGMACVVTDDQDMLWRT
jgi:hypothetical protein